MELLAGLSALLAVPALLLALYFGVLFFIGRGDRYGPLNDIASAGVLFLLILPALALKDLSVLDMAWFAAVSWVAIAGMVIAGIGQLMLVAGMISLNMSFVIGGIGFVPVLVWLGATTWLSIAEGVPPAAIGWTMLVGLAFTAAIVVAFRSPLRTRLILATAASIAIAASLLLLGIDLVTA